LSKSIEIDSNVWLTTDKDQMSVEDLLS